LQTQALAQLDRVGRWTDLPHADPGSFMPRPLASIAAILTLAAGPVAAQAPPPTVTPLTIARCTWASLPDRTRAALVASGPSIDDIGKAMSDMNPALMQIAQSQCPSAPTRQIEAASREAWAGVVITNWAEGELAARYAVAPAALARAWSHVSPAQRRQLASGFDATPEASRGSVASFATDLRLTDPAALDLLSAWAIAQIRLAALG
jgi:hypothetical protein